MDPDLLQQIAGSEAQQNVTGQQLADLIARRKAAAATPYTHPGGQLLGSIGDIIMGRKEGDLRAQQVDLAKQIAGARGQWGQQYNDAQQPVQAPPDSLAAPGYDAATQERARQQRLGSLRTTAMLSGDPTLTGYAKAAPGMDMEDLNLAKTREEMTAQNSPEAGAATRALLGKYGVNLPDTTPSATLRYLLPTAEKGYAADQAKEARLESARLMANSRIQVAGMGPQPTPTDPNALEPIPRAGPMAKQYTTLSQNFKKDMDAAEASSRSAFGQTANVVFRGARNLAILNQKNPDGTQRQLTLPEWQEVTGGLIAMQTGGVPTQEMMREGLPHDVEGSAAGIKSWLMSSPYAPDRQAWIERFLQNIQREEQTAKNYQREVQMQRLGSHSQYFSTYPNRAKQAAKGYGIDPGLVDQVRGGTFDPASMPAAAAPNGASVGGAPALSPKDAQAVQMARARLAKNPNDAIAKEVLRRNGVQ